MKLRLVGKPVREGVHVAGLGHGRGAPRDVGVWPAVSVVIPCRNERNYICRCVESILKNGYPGQLEIIIVDGMSEDGTREALRELEARNADLRIIDNALRITPVAMNLGLKAARGHIILRVDAHCELGPRYISTVVRQLLSHRHVGCVGGRTTTRQGGGVIERAIAAVLGSRFGVGNSYFRIPGSRVREVDTVAFGAYWRETLKELGEFNERLARNQDIELNYRLRKAGYSILLDPSVEVFYNPRRTIKAFWKQNFANGFWNIITWRLVPGSLSWRHFVPLFFVSWLIVFGTLGVFTSVARILFWTAIGAYGTLDVLESVRIAAKGRRTSLAASCLVFPILHLSYGVGSLCGVFSVLLRGMRAVTGRHEPTSQRS